MKSIRKRSLTALSQTEIQDEGNQSVNEGWQNVTECTTSLKLDGNMEISTMSDNSATTAGSESKDQDCMEKQDLRDMITIPNGRTMAQDNECFKAKATGCSEPITAGLEGHLHDPSGKVNESLSTAGSMGVGNKNDLQMNIDNAPNECAEVFSAPKDAESSDLWSDFMQFNTFCETSSRTNDQKAERNCLLPSSEVPTARFKSCSFPDQHQNLSQIQKCTIEPCPFAPVINGCSLKPDALKLDIPRKREEELPNRNDVDLSAEQCLTSPSLKWKAFKDDIPSINETAGCSKMGLSDCGIDGTPLPASNSLFQKQNYFHASSALKANTATHLESIFQSSFPFVCEKHSFENIPTLEEYLGINGEGNGANKEKPSTRFVSAWGATVDLNRSVLRSWWNGSHARENLLSTLGVAQYQKFPGENVLSPSTLEKIGACPMVTALPEDGNKPLIQTRVNINLNTSEAKKWSYFHPSVGVYIFTVAAN
ncbi:uncharacterized protein LOC103175281 isoform X2 [Callorhinchus milii]|uniref:uncharacterized protein LOC103175281 isoform X2 n=1 Tax=Callorhinchus milii TaxID=7868 RepID=UPI001C3F8B24|nr:uncharacterized protein LOC103175281 isoform X2 [Callorhinchus milii]